MKKLLLLSAVCLIATSASAFEVKPYVEGRISENFMKTESSEITEENIKLKDSFVQGGSVEVGVKLDQFRVGLEGYYNDKAKDGYRWPFGNIPFTFESKGLFLNGYWDIPLNQKFKKIKPYIGAGIGYSWLKTSFEYSFLNETMKVALKDKDWGWNAGLGVAYELNENVDITLGYRYENLGTLKKSETRTDFKNNKVSLGLRYTF